ncbi:MAG: xanthine dehydrogenase family protein molybdopterin-binding subunit, partial [Janthinobacterium lividum]
MDGDGPNRPNAYIGRGLPRPNLQRLTQGRGRYVSDVTLPRMVHAAFLRSPYAHAAILGIDLAVAKGMPGVIAVLDGTAMQAMCTPWVGVLSHLRGLKSAPQHPLAVGRVRWQGEPVAMVIAATRAEAEDAAEHILVDYDALDPVVDVLAALELGAQVIHPELGDNLAFERRI